MSLVETSTKKKMGRPKGSYTRRNALAEILKQYDFEPAAKIVEQYSKPDMPETERNRLLIALMPYVHMRLPQEQVISNPQALSLTINLGDKEEPKTIEHEDE